jgi:hypothetical protein
VEYDDSFSISTLKIGAVSYMQVIDTGDSLNFKEERNSETALVPVPNGKRN